MGSEEAIPEPREALLRAGEAPAMEDARARPAHLRGTGYGWGHHRSTSPKDTWILPRRTRWRSNRRPFRGQRMRSSRRTRRAPSRASTTASTIATYVDTLNKLTEGTDKAGMALEEVVKSAEAGHRLQTNGPGAEPHVLLERHEAGRRRGAERRARRAPPPPSAATRSSSRTSRPPAVASPAAAGRGSSRTAASSRS